MSTSSSSSPPYSTALPPVQLPHDPRPKATTAAVTAATNRPYRSPSDAPNPSASNPFPGASSAHSLPYRRAQPTTGSEQSVSSSSSSARPAPPIAVRTPNPARKAPSRPDLDEFRSAVTRDALREETRKAIAVPPLRSQPSAPRNDSAPLLAAEPQPSPSPPASPTMIATSRNPTNVADPRVTMPRTASIDSTMSSTSSSTATSLKQNQANAYRLQPDPNAPQDPASLIAAAGSAESAIQKLVNERNQSASHNAQLWRLVEKQRAMILGLNRDLEKSLKEKERYRRKLKDNMVESSSAPVLTSTGHRAEGSAAGLERSQSPASAAAQIVPTITKPDSLAHVSMLNRDISDSSDVASVGPGRSDTPQDAVSLPRSTPPATFPPATSDSNQASEDGSNATVTSTTMLPTEGRHVPAPLNLNRVPAATPPVGPPVTNPSSGFQPQHRKLGSTSSTTSPPYSAQSFSTQKGATRKAPPAPLQLSPKPVEGITNNIVDASDSEYEDDPDSARAEQMERGRRKTREDDDREREMAAVQEEEHRSRSKKDKSKSKSKSKSKARAEESDAIPEFPTHKNIEPNVTERPAVAQQQARLPNHLQGDDPAAILRQRVTADAATTLPRSTTAPALMSPGLPMSPRPGDRPLGSPMPRAPNKIFNSMPMSPKAGMAGLPLSPRAPKQPIPLPPQTPLSFASPHLARAEAYHQQAVAAQSSIADRLKPSPQPSPEHEHPSTSSEPKTPGEVYTGFVTEQYPGLLLPPNALPSIVVKTASSRMRPSRQSYIAPKHPDENPVLTLAVHGRSDNKQLWRVEKTLSALAALDTQVKMACAFRDHLPDNALFIGHAPAKIDARRLAIDSYFDRMLECITDEKAAKVVCAFLSTDAIGADRGADYFGTIPEIRPDTPVMKQRVQRAGYLTKRGKNFGGWKARYFVLDGPNLRYFEAPGGAHLGSIKLQNAQIGKQSQQAGSNAHEDEENQFRHAFLILEPKKKDSSSLVRHVLCAESDDERDAWVEALLQYVDYREGEDDLTRPSPGIRHDIGGARSPRLQKSATDLRPPSRGKDAARNKHDPLRAVNYSETVPGEAPIIGPASSAKSSTTPSPSDEGSFAGVHNAAATASHPTISGPTNMTVIQNAGEWGMKPPPTPSVKDLGKDKKRSMFAAFRGRSSSELAPNAVMSPGFPPDGSGNHPGGVRAVFGVPLAEAVEFGRPAGLNTELPAVVYRCIEYLTAKNAIAEEGIFRLSGSNTVIKSLKDRFNTEGDVNLTADETYYDIHAVASLLKLYLRELPASILTRELHLEFLQCLEMHGRERTVTVNGLFHRLPKPNQALLQALSAFLLSIVNNAEVNKMNVRNVGIVFAPTLNVPAPLISTFVEDQSAIFGPPLAEAPAPASTHEAPAAATAAPPAAEPTDLRSPRKQMFTDLPTPAYHQTNFPSFGPGANPGAPTGLIPLQPSYAQFAMAPQGEGGFGSLNDALRAPAGPTGYNSNSAANGVPTSRETKSRRRESGMMLLNAHAAAAAPRKPSHSRLRDDGSGGSF